MNAGTAVFGVDEVLSKVRNAFQAAFNIDPESVSIETAPENIPNWDSAGHLSLASYLEEAFGLSFDVDELMEMENVRAIVRTIGTKLSREAQSVTSARG